MSVLLAASANGLRHHQSAMDVVSNNLANGNTTAFKLSRVVAQGRPEIDDPNSPLRYGPPATGIDRIMDVGVFQSTGNPMTFAIPDSAFMRVTGFSGEELFTRVGELSSGSGGVLTTSDGLQVRPETLVPDGLIRLEIDASGQISGENPDGAREIVGRITLAKFPNPQGLLPVGNGLYAETTNSGEAVLGVAGEGGFDALSVGVVESSNVDFAREFTNLLTAQRAYQATAKAFNVGDQMMAAAADITG